MKKSAKLISLRKFLTYVGMILLLSCVTAPLQHIEAQTTKKASAKTAQKKKNTASKKASAPVRKSGDVKKEKQRTEKEIAETKKQISDTEKKITKQLNHLYDIDSQIERQQSTIEELNVSINNLNLRAELLKDSIATLMHQDSLLCSQIANGLRRQRVQRQQITPLAFITGSTNVQQALQRLSLIKTIERAESKRARQLRAKRSQIETARIQLDSVVAGHEAAVKQLATAKSILDIRRQESEKTVKTLRTQNETLNKVLKDKQKRIKQLDDELNRIIAEEQRKAKQEEERRKQLAAKEAAKTGSKTNDKATPASSVQGVADANRTLTGTFAANKGKLLFPVAGKYSITGTFGRSQHGELSHVQVDNSGIDISVASGTKARSSFEGTISSIFFMDGYENIVIVRHGEYLTVYAGLGSLNVKKGEKVKSGQTLGTIATIDGHTTLHFEVRKERSKLNPLQWVK